MEGRYRTRGLQFTGTMRDTGTTVHRYDTGYRDYGTQGRYRIQGLQYTGTVQDTGTTLHRDARVHSALAAKPTLLGSLKSLTCQTRCFVCTVWGSVVPRLGEGKLHYRTIFSAIGYAPGCTELQFCVIRIVVLETA